MGLLLLFAAGPPASVTDCPVIEARVGWRPDQFNHVINPGFETDTTGWAVTAGINGAATSVTRITTDFNGGAACAELVCPATALTGVNWDFGSQSFFAYTYGRHFYRAVVWLKAVSGTPYARIIFGSEGTSTDRATRDVVLSDQWQPFYVDWYPSATRTDAQLAVVNIPAVAMTCRLDDVAVFLRDALTQVENGNFTDDTGGWSVAADINAAGTSITRVAGDSPIAGFACGELVTTATSGSGCNWKLGARKFTSGRTYRLRVWIKSISGATRARLRLGSIATAVDRGDSSPAITTSWTAYTVDWTPSADRTDVELAITNGSASAMTARIAAVEVYEALDDISADAAAYSEGEHSTEPVLTFGRGGSFDNAGAAIGFANLRVINTTGKYTPENASGALYGLLAHRRPILIRAVYSSALYALFAGRIRRFVPNPMDHRTELVCSDALEDLRAIAYSELPSNPSYGAQRRTALARAGILNYGTGGDAGGAIEATRYWSGADDTNLFAYLESLNQATGSIHFVRPDPDALVAWRLITIDRTEHSDASSTSETWDDDLADLTGYDVTDEAVVNRQRVAVTAYRLAEDHYEDVFHPAHPRYVALAYEAASYSIVDATGGAFHVPVPALFSATLPDATMPLTVPANTRRVLHFSFGVPLGPTVVQDVAYTSGSTTETLVVKGNEATLTLDAGSSDAVIYFIGLVASPLLPLPINDADEADQQAQFQDGVERQGNPINSPYVSAPAHASGLARWLLWRYATARARPEARVERNYPRQLAREVGHRIALNFARLSLSAKPFVIAGFKTDVSENSRMWSTGYRLEELPAVPTGGWFTLGSSALDSDDVLAY